MVRKTEQNLNADGFPIVWDNRYRDGRYHLVTLKTGYIIRARWHATNYRESTFSDKWVGAFLLDGGGSLTESLIVSAREA